MMTTLLQILCIVLAPSTVLAGVLILRYALSGDEPAQDPNATMDRPSGYNPRLRLVERSRDHGTE